MYCRNCGELLNDNDKVCPACGTPVEGRSSNGYSYDQAKGAPNGGTQYYNGGTTQQTYQYSGPEYQPSADSGSFGWGILGCCLPLVGLILFLIWKDTKPMSAKNAGIGAIVGVVISVLLWIILVVVMGLSVGALGVGIAEGEFDLSELEQYLENTTDILTNVFRIGF